MVMREEVKGEALLPEIVDAADALGALHAGICSLPRVNDIAVGIALMLFGTGLAFYLGKPLVQPRAPTLPALSLGFWSDIPQVRAALEVNALFIVGVVMTPLLRWALANTRWGLIVRMVGDSAEAARAPAGWTKTTTGTRDANMPFTISRMDRSSPPGVSSSITRASYPSSCARTTACVMNSAVHGNLEPASSCMQLAPK